MKTRNLNNMYNDINTLKEKVGIYYTQYGKLPVLEELYTNISDINNINPNDNDKYYVVDLQALENITLTFGKDYETYKENKNPTLTDIYIINEQSHNVYYVKGITLDENTYYTVPGDYTKVEIDTSACNHPKLTSGMIPVKYNGTEFVETESYDPEWYEYIDTSEEGQESSSKWANVKTKDGSMWVWIPRYAYKITYNNVNDKSAGGTIDVVFLKDTTNNDFNGNDVTNENYVDANGKIGAYIVHPAFQDGTKNGFANGEWDEEITGFWMAKFEAGYAGQAGDATTAMDSKVEYSTILSWTGAETKDYEYNYYGTRAVGTKIKYPIFQGNRASMNFIAIADAYDLCMSIKNASHVYGLSNIDSHMTKNSEWGAVVYLAHSKYGRNGEEVVLNNITINNSTESLRAVTGFGALATDTAAVTTTWADIQSGEQAGSWLTVQGQTASTTGNVYGIYDLSGGECEWTTGYIATTGNYETYGGSLKGDSNKYRTKYSGTSSESNTNYNEEENINRIGDAVVETSIANIGSKSWNNNFSYFLSATLPFFIRGGNWGDGMNAGSFAFQCCAGCCYNYMGFRAVLIAE